MIDKIVDIHSHTIPNVDDGSKSFEESIEMLRLSEKSGTKTMVVTPHYFYNRFEEGYESVEKIFIELLEKVKEEKLEIEILLGQEVFLHNSILTLIKEEIIKPIGNSRYMLVEASLSDYSKDILDLIYEIRILGFTPILAHPERYEYVQKDITILNEFMKEGCLFQINSGSLVGIFGREAKKTSFDLVKNGYINFIGSDAHGIGVRNTDLREGLSCLKDLNEDYYERVIRNGNLLINNKTIGDEFEILKKKKSLFDFFRR